MDEAKHSLARQVTVKRVGARGEERVSDVVAAEEPLAIRVSHWFKDVQRSENLAVTMRTPGQDRELAAGLLLAEGIIREAGDLVDLRPLGVEPSNEILAE